MRQTLLWITSLTAALACSAIASAQVLIGEVRIDQTGPAGNSDQQEYYELRGPPGTPLAAYSYVVLGARPIQTISGLPYGGAGVIVHLNPFPANAVIPVSGLYLVRKTGMQLPFAVTAQLTLPLAFDDDATQTHLLVNNFAYDIFDDGTPPNVGFSPIGYDLDLDNDGVLDIVPWQSVVDSVSMLMSTTPDASNRAYSITQLGPASDALIPAHLLRCSNNSNWRVGQRTYSFYTPSIITRVGPTNGPFHSGSPYQASLNSLVEANGTVSVEVTLKADMDEANESVEVRLAGMSIGTLTGGYPACASGTRTLNLPMDTFNALRCGGSTMQVQVIPNVNVSICAGSNCKVTLRYNRVVPNPLDSPGRPNPACGCSCEFANGSVEVVFIVDTSGSMGDEAAALCAAIPEVTAALAAQGTFVQSTVLGITETPGGAFSCLTDNVLALLGAAVPDPASNQIGLLTHPESWGDATAIVADRFAWTPGFTRLIITISDEAPFEGNGAPGSECDAADAASVANAVAVATARGTIVSTLVGTGAVPCVESLAQLLAAGTGGASTSTQLPASQIAAIIADFLLEAVNGSSCESCKGDLNLDGVVDALDLALYNCLRDFACRDVNNDGSPGRPNDKALVENVHACGANDFCGTTQVSCLTVHPTPGCNDAACCAVVCAVDPSCCVDGWDSVCVANAINLCGPCGTTASFQSCFAAGSDPGCDDAACCAAVCAIDPFCCAIDWDAACVAIAKFECLYCGSPSTVSCFLPNAVAFCSDASCCNKVCNIDPACCDPSLSWDTLCVQLARDLCADCGNPNLGPCNQPSFSPSCENMQCCLKVCQIDPFCCEIIWDQQCADRSNQLCFQCGSLLAGSCCLKHGNPFCSDQACCETVCLFDPFCCTGTWDEICVSLTTILCPTLECPCGTNPASCFTAHATPGCNETLCCQSICDIDNFCCLVHWDAICANMATALCGTNGACVPGSGSCTVPHSTPGCDSPASCCSIVCAFLPECCTVAWDFVCVQAAFDTCQNCGVPSAGSCFSDSGSPGCADLVCCQLVCNIDPFCCAISWDGACVGLANAECGAPELACSNNYDPHRSCFMASPGRGCSTQGCCNQICLNIDSFCCEVMWDAICAQEASIFCSLPGNTNGIGSCFIPHCCGIAPGCAAPCTGCSDRGCAAAVCTYRSSCCTVLWDASCVEIALAVCIDRVACPSSGACNKVHRNPGCNDPSCCNVVCSFDPHCCEIQWDAACVDAERTYCRPASGAICPCDGGCFAPKSSPGCEDKSCCSGVCAVDPNCCMTQWDSQCASLARELCCGIGLCGDPCNKSCLVVHAAPYCDDSYCCEAVCEADPHCCNVTWDSLCVQYAAQRCVGACGQPSSGNCYAEHGSPGCRFEDCCKAVCRVDPLCCTEEWDDSCVKLAGSLPPCTSNKPKCGQVVAGPCCVPHDGPACSTAPCCNAVCAQDPSCCQEQWDELCVNIARTLPQCSECNLPCGATCAGSCCEPHATPHCSSLPCCEAVCFGWTDVNGVVYGGDAYCCNVQWDSNCSSRAADYSQILLKGGMVLEGPCFEACPQPNCGSPLSGDCCNQHAGPFCRQASCCEAVCAIDSFCCQVSWDFNCAALAQNLCPSCDVPGVCGTGGSCYFPHVAPFCSDVICCEFVCAVLPGCCSAGWDITCVFAAIDLCQVPPNPPVNDECAGSIAVLEGLSPFSSTDATTSVVPLPDVVCGAGLVTFERDVWFIFVPPQGGTWEVSTCNLTNFDTAVAIYEGACDNLLLRACANDTPFCAQLTSTVQWNAQINVPYRIRLGGPTGGSGNGYMLIRRIGP